MSEAPTIHSSHLTSPIPRAKSREVFMSECGILHLEGTSDLPMGLFLKEKDISLCLFIVSATTDLCDLRHCAVL